jgi:hypothetical protein
MEDFKDNMPVIRNKVEGKAAPLHTMEEQGGEEV